MMTSQLNVLNALPVPPHEQNVISLQRDVSTIPLGTKQMAWESDNRKQKQKRTLYRINCPQTTIWETAATDTWPEIQGPGSPWENRGEVFDRVRVRCAPTQKDMIESGLLLHCSGPRASYSNSPSKSSRVPHLQNAGLLSTSEVHSENEMAQYVYLAKSEYPINGDFQ